LYPIENVLHLGIGLMAKGELLMRPYGILRILGLFLVLFLAGAIGQGRQEKKEPSEVKKSGPPLLAQVSPQGRTRAVISGDGKRAITASHNTLLVWDVESGLILRRILNPQRIVTLAMSRDGQVVATGGQEGQVVVREKGSELFRYPKKAFGERPIGKVAVSPDGKWVAAAYVGELRVWNVSTKKMVETTKFSMKYEAGSELSFSENGKQLLYGFSHRKELALVTGAKGDFDTGLKLSVVKDIPNADFYTIAPDGKSFYLVLRPSGEVAHYDFKGKRLGGTRKSPRPYEATCLAIDSNGRTITGDKDGVLHIWSMKGGRRESKLHDGADIRSVAFTEDGKHAISAGDLGRVWLWPTSDKSTEKPVQLTGIARRIQTLKLSPDGLWLAARGEKLLHLWNLKTGQRVLHRGGSIHTLAFSPDSRSLVYSKEKESEAVVLDLATQKVTGRYVLPNKGHVVEVAFGAGGKVAMAGVKRKAKGSEVHVAVFEPNKADSPTVKSATVDGAVNHVLLGPGLEYFVAYEAKGGHFTTHALLGSGRSGKQEIGTLGKNSLVATLARQSKDKAGPWLFTSGHGSQMKKDYRHHTVITWDLDKSKQHHNLQHHSGYVRSMAVAHNPFRLLSGSEDGTAILWDPLVRGGGQRLLSIHEGAEIHAVAMSDNARRAVTASDDGWVRLWDLPRTDKLAKDAKPMHIYRPIASLIHFRDG
jgi:WD40 repeat protein